jgi:hypothetical protein
MPDQMSQPAAPHVIALCAAGTLLAVAAIGTAALW